MYDEIVAWYIEIWECSSGELLIKDTKLKPNLWYFFTVMDPIKNVKFDNLYIYWNEISANYAIDTIYNV